ncbi:MAG: 2-amino-4-hydroxy-6-hydroxymethyldihydropteridine diphosphokinase [Desulfobulbus sp.]|nr:2-amino-4-hydroxy-6-hydroxymethyldihydropteridine diphosphokinase [Desulfobulbus sp.]
MSSNPAGAFSLFTMDNRHTAVLGLGSNKGQSAKNLQDAWQALQKISELEVWRLSSPYWSKPVGMESCHWFVNAVGVLRTSLSPLALLHALQAVEIKFGRRRDPAVYGYQDRPLDLDLLLYDDIALETPELIIPHPRMGQRRFVLEPLVEVGDGIEFSPFGSPVATWAKRCLEVVAEQMVERCSWDDFQLDSSASASLPELSGNPGLAEKNIDLSDGLVKSPSHP